MTRLAVRMMLPAAERDSDESKPLDVEAVVVRRQEYRTNEGDTHYELALFFTHLATDDRDRIARYLES
jgi:hypothetical protein